jgi:SAM-dependent methyltransferase
LKITILWRNLTVFFDEFPWGHGIPMIKKALQTFLHPASPAAMYRHPGRILHFMRAGMPNAALRLGERLKPGGRVHPHFFGLYHDIPYLVVDRYKRADVLSNIRLPAGSVDRVLCCHVLEHIEDCRKGILELFRILKPDGSGVIAAPQTAGLARSLKTHEPAFQGYGHAR